MVSAYQFLGRRESDFLVICLINEAAQNGVAPKGRLFLSRLFKIIEPSSLGWQRVTNWCANDLSIHISCLLAFPRLSWTSPTDVDELRSSGVTGRDSARRQ